MNCPRCSTTMNPVTKGNRTIDTCSHCGGIWFDDDEMLNSLTITDSISAGPKDRAIQQTTGYNKTITCPKCNKATHEKNYMLTSNIFIDVCDECKGIFLDGGEMKAILYYLIKNDLFENNKEDKKTEEESSFFSTIKDFFKTNKFLQTSEKNICPRCQSALREIDFSGEKVDYCMDCGGTWFDRGELGDAIDATQDQPDPAANETGTAITTAKRYEPTMLCPKCEHTYLNKHNYMSSSAITIDSCNKCLGVWLDKNEFQSVVEYFNSSRNTDELIVQNQNLFTKIKNEHNTWQEKNKKIYWDGLKKQLPGQKDNAKNYYLGK